MHARARWYEEAAAPSFPHGPTEADQLSLRLALALREDDGRGVADALAALSQIEPARLSWNGGVASEFRDLDDRLPHALEAVTNGGAYLWIDFKKIERIEFAAVLRPRDLAFRRAQLHLHGGASARILVPALYDTRGTKTNAVRLGRETGWAVGPGGIVTGYGQRCFLSGDVMAAIAETKSIALGESEDG
jgi:type VI secretion system protein ImpE